MVPVAQAGRQPWPVWNLPASKQSANAECAPTVHACRLAGGPADPRSLHAGPGCIHTLQCGEPPAAALGTAERHVCDAGVVRARSALACCDVFCLRHGFPAQAVPSTSRDWPSPPKCPSTRSGPAPATAPAPFTTAPLSTWGCTRRGGSPACWTTCCHRCAEQRVLVDVLCDACSMEL